MDGLNAFQAFAELMRAQPQVTVVKLAGVAPGRRAEFATAADMRFARSGRSEVTLAGGGSTPGEPYDRVPVVTGRRPRFGSPTSNALLARRSAWVMP